MLTWTRCITCVSNAATNRMQRTPPLRLTLPSRPGSHWAGVLRETDACSLDANSQHSLVSIAYTELGPRQTGRPPIVLTPGGQAAGAAMAPLAERLVAAGNTCILWDRPNCDGNTSVCFAGCESEAELHAAALDALLRFLGIPNVFLFGLSNGARMSSFFARLRPDATSALVLNDVTAGRKAAQLLAEGYYKCHLRLFDEAGGGNPGLEAIMHHGHYGALCTGDRGPERAARIREAGPAVFWRALERWQRCLAAGEDSSLHPIAGVPALVFRDVCAPCFAVYTATGQDGMHTWEAITGAARCLKGPGGAPVDIERAKSESEVSAVVNTFLRSLPEL